jgi:energy-coupling factor transporter ATP-binding protein EcfA2
MLIRSLTLQNVKCFSNNATIDLTIGRADGQPHKWIVLFGDNGLGKSTLLKAFGLALVGQPGLNALLPNAEGWVRGEQRLATIKVVAQKGPQDTSVGFPRVRPFELAWSLIGRRSTKIDSTVQPAHSIVISEGHARRQQDDVKLFKSQIATDDRQRGWLLAGYGPHRRLTGAASDIAETISPDSRAARLVTLFHEKAALTSAERWLRDLHHSASVYKGRADDHLKAILRMINHGLMGVGVQLIAIKPDGVYFKTPFKPQVPIGDLSDGYRTVLALTLDVLRHVAFCFDIETVLSDTNGHSVVTAEGVVLIDEIDSHLHPSWQRTIAPWLHSRFPNLQFIVATHSPLIPTCVASGEGMVVRLTQRRQGSGEVVDPEVDLGEIGLTADQNLTGPNFGLDSTRDILADDLIREMNRLRRLVRRKRATATERDKLRQLEFTFEQTVPVGNTYAEAQRWRQESRTLNTPPSSVDTVKDE